MATPTPQQERVALRRSLYAPANARKNKLPTQAFLRAAEFGNFDGVRSMALDASAELSGIRCKDFLGCDPHHLVDSAHHLNNTERKKLKYQFTELPELINAVGHVQTLEPQPDLDIFDTRAISKNKSKTARPETPPLARTKGITGRLARSENNLTRLASTLTVRHEVCEAAKSQPRLIWEKARSGEQALPALARALKNERLAVRATQMNPKLLRVGEPQIRKIMPTLVSICGGAEQAAYAIVWRPELLELEAASALRDSLQAASGFFGNLKDALFLLGQTTAPPSVRVIARQFCREYMVGEYFLVDGAQVDDRPVWCKPAAAMQSLGSKAKDVYLIYCQKGVVGSDSMLPCWTFTTKYSASLKKYDYCDPSILGWTEAKVKSPDQVEPGQWHFPAEAHKTQVPGLWPADPYVRCDSGSRARGPWLCTQAPQKLSDACDALRFATGLVWLTESTGTGPTPGGARLLGHFIKNDPVYADSSKITFLDLADFAHIRRWSYLQLPLAPAGQPVEKSVKLYAWEPVEVCMVFSKQEGEDLDPNTAAELRRAEFRPTPERAVAKSFPKLQGAPAPVSEEVWARTYASGPFEVPVVIGPHGLPPMIFIRSQIAAHVHGTGPCHQVRLVAGEEIYLPVLEDPTPNDPGATLLPKPPPVMYHFVSPGELGYTGYELFKGPASSQNCTPSEIQMRVESLEVLSVAMLLFPKPKVEVSTLLPEEPAKDTKKRNSKSSRTSSKQTPPPTEPEPPKGSKDSMGSEATLAPVPHWVDSEESAWQPLPQKLHASIASTDTKKITCAHVYLQTLEAGQVLEVPGCGPDFFALFLFKQLSPRRPDLLRQLLMREPALLCSGDPFEAFFTRMRRELGDLVAREVVLKELQTVVPPGHFPSSKHLIWPKLCQQGTEAQIFSWIYDRKVEVLAAETNAQAAPSILSRLGGASFEISAPELQERCKMLRKLLPKQLAEVLLRLPELLRFDPLSLSGSFETIQMHLGSDEALKSCSEHLRLLTLHPELVHFFEVLNAKFTDEELRTLHRIAGEWIQWPRLVGQPDEEIQTWQGRVFAQCREGRAKDEGRRGLAPFGGRN
ncbi:unnamed protein product [Durusdinium trenchii]|uniref:Uncharacterized protein n=1 Tax=Durusdinium trenchii TaxID=1381693 RepID=A0ABP0QZX3_9DINO